MSGEESEWQRAETRDSRGKGNTPGQDRTGDLQRVGLTS